MSGTQDNRAVESAATSQDVASVDVCIIGAGAAGACAAHVLAGRGLSIALIDPKFHCRPTFKAEKLEPDQVALLTELDLLRHVRAICSPIDGVTVFRGRRKVKSSPIKQYGMRYEDFVNSLIESLPPDVRQIRGRVEGIDEGADCTLVSLADKSKVRAQVLIAAAGTTFPLARKHGLDSKTLQDKHTVAFGFDLECHDKELLTSGKNFLPSISSTGIGFLTLFPVRGATRANLFTYLDPQSDACKRMRAAPAEFLSETFPGLASVIGEYSICGRVDAALVDLWTSTPQESVRFMAIGDSFQSVCPATGTGLSKVLTDVSVLASIVSGRQGSDALRALKLSNAYYGDRKKQRTDSHSIESATSLRRLALEPGLTGILRRRGWSLRTSLHLMKTLFLG